MKTVTRAKLITCHAGPLVRRFVDFVFYAYQFWSCGNCHSPRSFSDSRLDARLVR